MYDVATSLNYAGSRYYDSSTGKFLSQDPVFQALGDRDMVQSLSGRNQEQFLADPQQLNSYSYARNNPMRYSDPTGNASDDPASVKIGDWGNNLYNSSPVAQAVMDHPFTIGVAAMTPLITLVSPKTGVGMIAGAVTQYASDVSGNFAAGQTNGAFALTGDDYSYASGMVKGGIFTSTIQGGPVSATIATTTASTAMDMVAGRQLSGSGTLIDAASTFAATALINAATGNLPLPSLFSSQFSYARAATAQVVRSSIESGMRYIGGLMPAFGH